MDIIKNCIKYFFLFINTTFIINTNELLKNDNNSYNIHNRKIHSALSFKSISSSNNNFFLSTYKYILSYCIISYLIELTLILNLPLCQNYISEYNIFYLIPISTSFILIFHNILYLYNYHIFIQFYIIKYFNLEFLIYYIIITYIYFTILIESLLMIIKNKFCKSHFDIYYSPYYFIDLLNVYPLIFYLFLNFKNKIKLSLIDYKYIFLYIINISILLISNNISSFSYEIYIYIILQIIFLIFLLYTLIKDYLFNLNIYNKLLNDLKSSLSSENKLILIHLYNNIFTKKILIYSIILSIIIYYVIFIITKINVITQNMNVIILYIYNVLIKIYIIINFKLNVLIIKENNDYTKTITEPIINKKLKDFMNYIFHDIRIPINTLQLSIDLIKSNHIVLNDNILLETINKMEASLEFMTTTINNTINFNKIIDNSNKNEIVLFDIKVMINRIIKTIESQLLNKNINIIIDIEKLIKTNVYSDIYKIEHIIINLLNNAIKFTFKDTIIKINVSAIINKNETINKATLSNLNEIEEIYNYTFSISDQGPGISAENISKIFEEFVQLNTSQKKSGFGIGLSIVKKYVTELNGEINCKSILGQGATFYFTIPMQCKKTKYLIESNKHDLINLKIEKIDNIKVKSILDTLLIAIIDDSETNCKILQKILTNIGIKSNIYLNGEKLLNEQNINIYNLMIIDYYMPNLDGPSLIKIIRDRNYTNIIIGLTGNTDESDIENLFNSGADIVLEKPLQMKYINKIIKYIVDNDCNSARFKNNFEDINVRGPDLV